VGGEVREVDGMEADLCPGSCIVLEMEVRNQGTGMDNITLALTSPRSDWPCSIASISTIGQGVPENMTVDPSRPLIIPSDEAAYTFVPGLDEDPVDRMVLGLGRDMSVRVQVEIRAPRTAAEMDINEVVAEVSSSGPETDEGDNRVEAHVRVVMADLAFASGSKHYGELPAGHNLTVDTSVINVGMYIASDFRIVLMAGDNVVDEMSVPSLGPGASIHVVFDFIVGAEQLNAWLVIDPDETVVESDESNNRQAVDYTLAEEGGGSEDLSDTSASSMMSVFALIVILAVAVIAAYPVMRRRASDRGKDGVDTAPMLMAEVESIPGKTSNHATPTAQPVMDVTGPQHSAAISTVKPQPLVQPKAPALAGEKSPLALPPAAAATAQGAKGVDAGGAGARGVDTRGGVAEPVAHRSVPVEEMAQRAPPWQRGA
jgi:hypothetical protein